MVPFFKLANKLFKAAWLFATKWPHLQSVRKWVLFCCFYSPCIYYQGTFYTLITQLVLHFFFFFVRIENALMSGICFDLVKCQRRHTVKGKNAAKTSSDEKVKCSCVWVCVCVFTPFLKAFLMEVMNPRCNDILSKCVFLRACGVMFCLWHSDMLKEVEFSSVTGKYDQTQRQ